MARLTWCPMNAAHFTDERIAEVEAGAPLTPEERAFLLEDTPRFEECDKETAAALPGMDDKTLMRTAYWVWVDYCRCL